MPSNIATFPQTKAANRRMNKKPEQAIKYSNGWIYSNVTRKSIKFDGVLCVESESVDGGVLKKFN